jgi:hypothetical protein
MLCQASLYGSRQRMGHSPLPNSAGVGETLFGNLVYKTSRNFKNVSFQAVREYGSKSQRTNG